LESADAIVKTLPKLRIVDPVEFLAVVRAQFGSSS
jgi:hypothetical protein